MKVNRKLARKARRAEVSARKRAKEAEIRARKALAKAKRVIARESKAAKAGTTILPRTAKPIAQSEIRCREG